MTPRQVDEAGRTWRAGLQTLLAFRGAVFTRHSHPPSTALGAPRARSGRTPPSRSEGAQNLDGGAETRLARRALGRGRKGKEEKEH